MYYFHSVLENFLNTLKARIVNHSVEKLVKFRDAFQEHGFSLVCFLHIYFFPTNVSSAIIWRVKHVLFLCIIYETSKNDSFHLDSI